MPWRGLIVACLALVTAACESPFTPSGSSVSLPPAAPVDTSIRIPIGGSAQVTVGLNDPVTNNDPLGLEGWDDYHFRVVHVIASEPMQAIVRVVSDTETDARPAAWHVLNRICCSWYFQSIHQAVVTFPAATDLQVELDIPLSGPAATFTVSAWRADP